MSRVAADRNLLFGILALQMDFITRDALIAGMNAWVLEKHRPIGEILVDRGALDSRFRALLEPMVAAHVERHNGDPAASLAALSSVETAAAVLRRSTADLEVLESLASLPESRDEDPYLTRAGASPGPSLSGVRYTKVRDHARGGLGVVFVARDEELNREVALKEIQDRHADDPNRRARFLIEAEVTGGLEHPGIVPVYGLGAYEDGRPFYAMRFIRGESLKESIAGFHADTSTLADPGRRSLALQKLLRRFLDVCNAIEYAHSRGVLHRDLKPDNVMIGKYGETLVVDWGLAKATGRPGDADSTEASLQPASASGSDETLPGSVIGTPAYMSPEQAEGRLDLLGPTSDVYSLGATLFTLLTGRPPFRGMALVEILAEVRAGRFPRPREAARWLDPALEAVCLKAMALRPIDRYATPQALAREVEAWIAGEPVTAYPDPWAARIARWARRHRTAVVALGLSMATAVVLLTISTVLVGNAQRETAGALGRVVQEQGRTSAALRRADADFRQARQAVEDYFTTVSEDTLLNEPGMQPLRQKLLRSALDYHDAFLRDHGGDPTLVAELAVSHRRYANLASLTERTDDALPHFRSALGLFEVLARKPEDGPKYRRLIALTLADLGVFLSERKGQEDEATRINREAIALFEGLLRAQPGDPGLLEGLATALTRLGLNLSIRKGSGEEAGRHFGRSREILQRLILEQPDSLRYRVRLGDLFTGMYNNFVGNRLRQDEALRASEDALEVYRELLKRSPNSPAVQYKLAMIHDTRGMIYDRRMRTEESLRESEEARRILSRVVRNNPEVIQYRPYLGMVCMRVGLVLVKADAGEKALEPLREAIEAFESFYADKPDTATFQDQYFAALSGRGSALYRLGRYDESIEEYRKAAGIIAAVCRREPSSVFNQGDAMVNHINMGYALTYAGRHAEAVAAYEAGRAIGRDHFGGEMSHGGGVDELTQQLHRAYSLQELGRDGEADEIVGGLRKVADDDPEKLYYLVRFDARAARLRVQAIDPAGTRKALEDRAMEELVRAVGLGFSDLPALRTDQALNAIRDQPAFRRLITDLAMPTDPFAPTR